MRLYLQLIFFCSIWTLINTNDDNQLIVIEDENVSSTTSDDISDETLSDKPIKIFQATNEWKEVNDEILPKGLHVRINLETGKKEAKLLEDLNEVDVNSQITTKYHIATKTQPPNVKLLTDVEDRFLRDINKKHRNVIDKINDGQFKMQMKHNLIKTESEILKNLLNRYNESNIDYENKISILNDLEYLVHTIDLGKDFYDFDGFDLLLKDLNNINQTDYGLMIEILNVFGSAIQSNSYVKQELYNTTFLRQIISLLSHQQQQQQQDQNLDNWNITKKINIIRKCFFVISTLLRNSPTNEQLKFLNEFDGIKLIKNLLNIEELKLSVKIITFLSDIINEDSTIIKIKIDEEMCVQFIKILQYDDNNNQLDKSNLILYLESILSFVNVCHKEFNNGNLIENLHLYTSLYEDDEFVQTNLNQLKIKMDRSIKDEL